MSAVIYVVSRRKQVCRFRHSISCVAFNRFIIEKALSHISNMGSTSSAKSLLNGGIARFPPPVVDLVTLQLFQNWLSRISVAFPVCFLVNKNSFRTDITCNLTRYCGLPLLFAKKYLSSQLELNFLFFSDTSLLTLIVKLLYLKRYDFIIFTMHIF